MGSVIYPPDDGSPVLVGTGIGEVVGAGAGLFVDEPPPLPPLFPPLVPPVFPPLFPLPDCVELFDDPYSSELGGVANSDPPYAASRAVRIRRSA